jgi:S1-C subfamily serine protease
MTSTSSFRASPQVKVFAAVIAIVVSLQVQLRQAVAESFFDSKGTSAPCVGVMLPVGKKCAQLAENAGLISGKDLGYSGMTFTTTGPDDGKIASVAKGLAADAAGLEAGDRILTVNGKPAAHTLPEIAEIMTFGARGEKVQLRVVRADAPISVEFTRDPQDPPPGPNSGTILIYVKPMINWKGEFMPCAGAGPAGMAAIEFCWSHFKPDGYIKATDLGTTGLTFDTAKTDGAWIQTVAPGSGAEKAGLRAGDRLVQVNGKDLTESVGEAIHESLFAKSGAKFTLTFVRDSAQKTADMTLGKKK